MATDGFTTARNQGGTPGQPNKKKTLWRVYRTVRKWAIRFYQLYEFYERATIAWGVLVCLTGWLIAWLDWPVLAFKVVVALLHNGPFIKALLWVVYHALKIYFGG